MGNAFCTTEKTNPLISVIVPVYRVEQYLTKCVDSIVSQTYRELEILLVDDGSPDECPEMCDAYALSDARVITIHKPNGGLSDARNAGLKLMSGENLMFVDSDDVLAENAASRMNKLLAENHAQLVIGNYCRFENDEEIDQKERSEEARSFVVFDAKDAIKDFFQCGCASWARMYKREIHRNIYFPTGEINEDEAVVLPVLDRCQRIVKTKEITYFYRFRKESITTNEFTPKKTIWCKHCQQNIDYVRIIHPELLLYALNRYRGSVVWALNNMTARPFSFKKNIADYRAKLKSIRKDPLWTGNVNRKECLREWMLTYCYYPYALIVRLLGKHYT